ncbi:antibiotic biosynthesis monooxygenase [Micromonospora sp. CPCC 205371]|nr:antibiotic biosynthesis monooxygenase [Micromonospora sp. CPCC 205371]
MTPTTVRIVEHWANRQAFDEHFTTPHLRHAQRVLDRILARPLPLRMLAEAP